MIILYTGMGKGKTSAAIGHVIRAYGAGLSIAFCQFIKQDGISGEQEVLKQLLGENSVYIGGKGFVRGCKDLNKHIRAAIKTMEWATAQKADLLVMDEVIDAINLTLVHEFMIEDIVNERKENENKHLVLTGHDAGKCQRICGAADYITEFRNERHPFARGRSAIKGIEY